MHAVQLCRWHSLRAKVAPRKLRKSSRVASVAGRDIAGAMAILPDELATLHRAAVAPALLAMLLALAGTGVALARLRWPAIPSIAAVLPIAVALGLVALGLIRRLRHLLAAARRR